jgi:CxxC-x17-CxxC domain-containing protein
MYKATCAECGNMCEVPFRPNGEKPVYCSNCFSNKRGSDDRAPRRDFGRPSPSFNRASAAPSNDGEVKRQLEAISYKLDQLTRTIERLTPVKAESPKAEVKKMVVKSTKTTKAPAKKAKKK